MSIRLIPYSVGSRWFGIVQALVPDDSILYGIGSILSAILLRRDDVCARKVLSEMS